MRGRISFYDVRAGRGKIRGDDKRSYGVMRADVAGPLPVVAATPSLSTCHAARR
jgi:hypothetical protein